MMLVESFVQSDDCLRLPTFFADRPNLLQDTQTERSIADPLSILRSTTDLFPITYDDHVQLSNAIFIDCHGNRNTVFFDQHVGIGAMLFVCLFREEMRSDLAETK